MSNSSTLCLDASFVVGLLGTSTDPQIEYNFTVWRKHGTRFVAPRLIRYEATNAIRQLVRHGKIDRALAREAVSSLLELPIDIVDADSMHVRALELSARFNLPASYDAHYLALAEEFACPFWTADKKLVRAVRHELNWVHLFEP